MYQKILQQVPFFYFNQNKQDTNSSWEGVLSSGVYMFIRYMCIQKCCWKTFNSTNTLLLIKHSTNFYEIPTFCSHPEFEFVLAAQFYTCFNVVFCFYPRININIVLWWNSFICFYFGEIKLIKNEKQKLRLNKGRTNT